MTVSYLELLRLAAPETVVVLTALLALSVDLLVMRDWDDFSASRSYKKDTVDELRTFGFEPRLAFEDDRRNVDMFRAEGIPCVYVHSGYYD